MVAILSPGPFFPLSHASIPSFPPSFYLSYLIPSSAWPADKLKCDFSHPLILPCITLILPSIPPITPSLHLYVPHPIPQFTPPLPYPSSLSPADIQPRWPCSRKWSWRHVATGPGLWRSWRRTGWGRCVAALLTPPCTCAHMTSSRYAAAQIEERS